MMLPSPERAGGGSHDRSAQRAQAAWRAPHLRSRSKALQLCGGNSRGHSGSRARRAACASKRKGETRRPPRRALVGAVRDESAVREQVRTLARDDDYNW